MKGDARVTFWQRKFASEARSPSGKAKVCKTFIGGSIPPRASKVPFLAAP